MSQTFEIHFGNTSISVEENEPVIYVVDRILKSNPRYEQVDIRVNEKLLGNDITLHSETEYKVNIYTTAFYKGTNTIVPHKIDYFSPVKAAREFLAKKESNETAKVLPQNIIVLHPNNTFVNEDSFLGDSLVFNYFIKTSVSVKFIIDDETKVTELFSSDATFSTISSYIAQNYPKFSSPQLGIKLPYLPDPIPIPESWMDDPYCVHQKDVIKNTLFVSEKVIQLNITFIDEDGNSIPHKFPSNNIKFREIVAFLMSNDELFPNLGNPSLEYKNKAKKRKKLPPAWMNDPYSLHQSEITKDALYITQSQSSIPPPAPPTTPPKVSITFINGATTITHEFGPNTLFRTIKSFPTRPLKIKGHSLAFKNRSGEQIIIPHEWDSDPYSKHQNEITNDTLYAVPFAQRFPPNESLSLKSSELINQTKQAITRVFQKENIKVTNILLLNNIIPIVFASKADKQKAVALKQIKLNGQQYDLAPLRQSLNGQKEFNPATSVILYNYSGYLLNQLRESFKNRGFEVLDSHMSRQSIYIKLASQEEHEEACEEGSIELGSATLPITMHNPSSVNPSGAMTQFASSLSSDDDDDDDDDDDRSVIIENYGANNLSMIRLAFQNKGLTVNQSQSIYQHGKRVFRLVLGSHEEQDKAIKMKSIQIQGERVTIRPVES